MKNEFILALFSLTLLCMGCYKEDALVAKEGLEFHYTVPQGQSPEADPKIVDYYNKYGFYILYDFRPADMFWNNTSWNESVVMKQGDPAYAAKHLDLVEKAFFNYWDERYMKYLPKKVLLCSRLDDYSTTGGGDGDGNTVYDIINRVNIYVGYDNIGLNGCSAELDTMTFEVKGKFQTEVNAYMLGLLFERGDIVVPQEFADADVLGYTYQVFYTNTQVDSMFRAGYLSSQTLTTDKELSIENDFRSYLKLAAMPLELLEGEPAEFNYDDIYLRSDPPLWGCMNSLRDPYGRIRVKYNAMMSYLESLGLPVNMWQYPEHLKD